MADNFSVCTVSRSAVVRGSFASAIPTEPARSVLDSEELEPLARTIASELRARVGAAPDASADMLKPERGTPDISAFGVVPHETPALDCRRHYWPDAFDVILSERLIADRAPRQLTFEPGKVVSAARRHAIREVQ
jgi:hypothetical protein